MKKLLPVLPLILGVGALLTALVIPLAAAAIVRSARQVYLLTPHDKDTVEVNKFMFDTKPEDPAYDRKLMEIYGLPGERKEPVLFVDESKLVYPAGKEKRPDLVFLAVDKAKGENPWQTKIIEFGAHMMRGGAVITGAFFLVLFVFLLAARPALPGRSPAADVAAH